jgi:tRNA 2-thiouridine synthesizing protein A
VLPRGVFCTGVVAGAGQGDGDMDIKEIKPDEILDCCGLACPMPIFKASKKINEMQPGQVLEVQSDDDGIEKDMPAWCDLTGNEYIGQIKEGDEYHVFVRKK